MRDQMFRTLRRCFVLLLIGMTIWSCGNHGSQAALTAPESVSTGLTVQVQPAATGGMHFNPEAELDTSNFEDWR